MVCPPLVEGSSTPVANHPAVIHSNSKVPPLVEGVELEPDLTYSEYPIQVLDQKDRVTRRRTIKFYKIQWNQHSEEEATWESEDYLLEKFPEFLASIQNRVMLVELGCYQLCFVKGPQLFYGQILYVFLRHISFSITYPMALNLGARFLLGGRIVTSRVFKY